MTRRMPWSRSSTTLARHEARQGLLFIGPWLIGFIALTAFPMVVTFILSLSNVELDQRDPLRFVGLDNYVAFFNDQQALGSLSVTIRFAVLWLPLSILVPFGIALLLNSEHLPFKGM